MTTDTAAEITTGIADAVARLEQAVERRASFGAGTTTAVTTLDERLRCTTTEGRWTTVADLGPALGGNDTAPSPGTLMRAALGSCLAMTYRLRAAARGVELRSVEVTIESDSTIAGMLGRDSSVAPGFTGVRYHVAVESTADERDVAAVLDEADRLSPVLDDLRRTVDVVGTHAIHRYER